MPVRVVALVLSCAAALLTSPALAGAAPSGDPAEWLFTPSEVVQVDLTLGQGAIEDLAGEPGEYVPAGFELHGSGGRAFGPWAIQLKLKGNASFRTLAGKAAFKLKFPSGSRPSGLRKLTLNNMVQDPSKVREVIAYDLFRAMGVAAPRAGYAQVRVNGADYGLYLNVETLDSVALPHWFSSTEHLYEGTYDYGTGTPLSTLEPGGEAFFEVDEGDEDDRADLQGLIAALQNGGPLASALGGHADLHQMVRMLATEAVLGDWDGYGWNVNNFYLHADAAGRFSLLPWGADQTLQSWVPVEGGPWEVRGVLLRRCLQDVACRAVRRAAMLEARRIAEQLDLAGRAAALHARLRPLIDADPRREHTLAQSDAAAADVQAFLAARRLPADPPAPAPVPESPATPDQPAPVPAPAVPAATAVPAVRSLGDARARVAASAALRARFGASFTRASARSLTCTRVSVVSRRCRARWTSRGVRVERRVLVRADGAGRVTAHIA